MPTKEDEEADNKVQDKHASKQGIFRCKLSLNFPLLWRTACFILSLIGVIIQGAVAGKKPKSCCEKFLKFAKSHDTDTHPDIRIR